MTITENTCDRLIVEHVPWGVLAGMIAWMSIWIAGAVVFILDDQSGGALVFLGLGTFVPMALIWATLERHQLVLDRRAGTAELRCRSFRGVTRKPLAVADIKRISVRLNGLKNGTVFLEVTGDMDAEHHKFPNSRVPLAKAQAAADTMTVWLSP